MDTLHDVLRTIQTETKTARPHLNVFRQFLAHLDHLQRKAPVKPARAESERRASRRGRSPASAAARPRLTSQLSQCSIP